MEKQKQCFKCGQTFPLSGFYVHSMMADGHLNKCKECTKKDTAERAARKMQDVQFVISERKRHREKSARARANGTATQSANANQKKWRKSNPHKSIAHGMVQKAVSDGTLKKCPCLICGDVKSQAHHEDYSRPLSVHWLCSKHHGERHTFINECNLLMIPVPSVEDQFELVSK